MSLPRRLSDVIVDDHQSLLEQLDTFVNNPVNKPRYRRLCRLLHRLSACHFSEEITLYEQEGVSAGQRRRFKSYHAMLDNLHDTIQFGGPSADAIEQELLLLRALTNIHFTDEEREVLPEIERHLNSTESRRLAEIYSQSVEQLCSHQPAPYRVAATCSDSRSQSTGHDTFAARYR